jgi:hypothetical protein
MPSPNLWTREDTDVAVVAAGRAWREDLRAEPVFPLPLEGEMWKILDIKSDNPCRAKGY